MDKINQIEHSVIPENKQNEAESLSLCDIKKIKYNGNFLSKHLSTCPVLPKFHSAYGEPTEMDSLAQEQDRKDTNN